MRIITKLNRFYEQKHLALRVVNMRISDVLCKVNWWKFLLIQELIHELFIIKQVFIFSNEYCAPKV